MNIIEALTRSKETGERFHRPSFPYNGTIFWTGSSDSADYDLRQEDILADDWEVVPQVRCVVFPGNPTITYFPNQSWLEGDTWTPPCDPEPDIVIEGD